MVLRGEREVCRTPQAWQHRRLQVCLLADQRCQRCGHWTPLQAGDAHHRKRRGMGGSQRDDRPTNLEWLCGACHAVEHHGPKPCPAKGSK